MADYLVVSTAKDQLSARYESDYYNQKYHDYYRSASISTLGCNRVCLRCLYFENEQSSRKRVSDRMDYRCYCSSDCLADYLVLKRSSIE